MKKLVVLTGAGMSAESGIKTFRDADGLWEGHDVMEVASPQGFAAHPELVLEFYNQRRAQLNEVEPNSAHIALAELENQFSVTIITQNVDDLHERAGSANVLHLHGELRKVRPVDNMEEIIAWENDLHIGHTNNKGVQLRPHIVWFGEEVPKMDEAIQIVTQADLLVIIGTSLQVYPAAGLMNYRQADIPLYLIDPKPADIFDNYLTVIEATATEGMKQLTELLNEYESF